MTSTAARPHDLEQRLKSLRPFRIRKRIIQKPIFRECQGNRKVIIHGLTKREDDNVFQGPSKTSEAKVISIYKHRDCKKSAESSTPELPLDLIFGEILVRLPVKSLARFKCVAKQWRSTIEDRHFAESHASRAVPVLVRDCEELTSSGTPRPSPCNSKGFWGYEIIAVFDGLVVQRVWDKYSVKNPATSQTLSLPDPLGESRRMWFDHDPLSGDPKLLCEYAAANGETGYQILTIGRDEQWRSLRAPRGEDLLMASPNSPGEQHREVHFLGLTFTGRGVDLHVSTFDIRTERFAANDFPRGVFPDLSRVVPFWWGGRLAVGDLAGEELRVAVLEESEGRRRQWGGGGGRREVSAVPLRFLREIGQVGAEEKLVPVSAGEGSLWFHYDGVCKFRYDLRAGRVDERRLLANERREAAVFEYRPSLKSLRGMSPVF